MKYPNSKSDDMSISIDNCVYNKESIIMMVKKLEIIFMIDSQLLMSFIMRIINF